MNQPPDALLQLVARIKKEVAHKDFEKKHRVKGQRMSPEQLATIQANKLAAVIEEAKRWIPKSISLITRVQHCKCGEMFRCVSGIYLHSEHRISKAQKWSHLNDMDAAAFLPHTRDTFEEDIPICPVCMIERDLVEALVHRRPDNEIQGVLFDGVLATKMVH